MKSRIRETVKGIALTNQENIRILGEKENYKYSGILNKESIKQAEIKKKIRETYLRSTIKLLETLLYSRNLIKWINTWAVSLVRYSGPLLE